MPLPFTRDERCPSKQTIGVLRSLWCQLDAGHDGLHQQGRARWGYEERARAERGPH